MQSFGVEAQYQEAYDFAYRGDFLASSYPDWELAAYTDEVKQINNDQNNTDSTDLDNASENAIEENENNSEESYKSQRRRLSENDLGETDFGSEEDFDTDFGGEDDLGEDDLGNTDFGSEDDLGEDDLGDTDFGGEDNLGDTDFDSEDDLGDTESNVEEFDEDNFGDTSLDQEIPETTEESNYKNTQESTPEVSENSSTTDSLKQNLANKLAKYQETGSREDYLALLEALPTRKTFNETGNWASEYQGTAEKIVTDSMEKDFTQKLNQYQQTGARSDYIALLETLPLRTVLEEFVEPWVEKCKKQNCYKY